MSTGRQLLGSDNARDDSFLLSCHVTPPGDDGKPILSGRWGVGKTGHLLYRNRKLNETLRSIDRTASKLWYCDEGGLDARSIVDLKTYCSGDNSLLKKLLEEIWRAEILRVMTLLLNALYKHYNSPDGDHWRYVKGRAKAEKVISPIWQMLPSAARLIAPSRAEALEDLQEDLRSNFGAVARKAIQRCLIDIEHFEVQPVVAIEPIETPNSDLELKDPNLSLLLTTALIDLFQREFVYNGDDQLIRVELSIPWHRDLSKELREPHKLSEHEGKFRWNRSSLRRFINARLKKEFEDAGNHAALRKQADPFEIVFGSEIPYKESGISEDMFSYFIRHTRYRPRDLLRLCRQVILYHVDNRGKESANYTAEDFFRELKNREQISPRIIRSAINKTCLDSADETIREGERRHPQIEKLCECLRGISVPFSTDELKGRLDTRRGYSKKAYSFDESLEILWQAGILGVELFPPTLKERGFLRGLFGSESVVTYRGNSGESYRCYLFVYNLRGQTISQIVNTFDRGPRAGNALTRLALTLHPLMFQYFGARVSDNFPIGT